MPEAYPTLRAEIDAAPAERDGETYYILHDRAGIAPSRLLVSPLGLLVAGRLDGASSILDIADGLGREYGGAVRCQDVMDVVQALDEALFLDGARFQDYQAEAAREFRSEPLRAAGSAGSVYATDPAVLASDLDDMMRDAPPPEEAVPSLESFPRGMIVPHIDYHRGAAGYGQCYRVLRAAPTPDTVVVVGTAHVPLRERFSLCEKDFDTPLGPVRVNHDLAGAIRQALAPIADVDRDVLAHRGEHSIELQAVWLRHLYGDAVRIVPILAGSIGEFIEGDREPGDAVRDPVIRAMADCLAGAAATGNVMIMASADLSHIGPRFGDRREISHTFLGQVEVADRDYLEAVALGAVDGLDSLASHNDLYHVCGSASIFVLGLALPGVRTHLLGYHQAVTPEMRQAVTFAGMVFE